MASRQTLRRLLALSAELRETGPRCKLWPVGIESLSDYFDRLYSATGPEGTYWFRGHAAWDWKLTPSALRFDDHAKRKRALDLWREFRRVAEIRFPGPQDHANALRWMQLAQHYGLPTRLLDWTQNAAIGLYFACFDLQDDGLVFILNPVNLNRQADPLNPSVLDPHKDAKKIEPYFALGARRNPGGPPTVAINPLWNSERIVVQKGAFTLHGSRSFSLDEKQAPGLTCLPVLAEFKERLRAELERVGVDEMAIFPEPEHVASHLRRKAGLV